MTPVTNNRPATPRNRPPSARARRPITRRGARRATAALVVFGAVLAGASPALAAAPTVAAGTTGSGPDAPHNSVRLTAYVDANGTATTYRFQYATDPAFADAVSVPAAQDGDAGSGEDPQIVSADLTGLQPATTYYWRVSVDNADGTDSTNTPHSFETYPTPPSTDCPNKRIRQRQGIDYISNCRAYELVSSAFKTANVGAGQISRSGNRALYRLQGGADQTAFGLNGFLMADRTAAGWTVSDPSPPRSAFGTDNAQVIAASPELDVLTWAGLPGFGRPGPGRVLRYVPETGDLTFGSQVAPDRASDLAIATASDDQRHVVLSLGPLGSTIKQAYSLDGPTAEIVSVLPDGGIPVCGVTGFWATSSSSFTQHQISVDGSRVFFAASDATCATPRHLYMRTGGAGGSTELIAGPPVAGQDFGVTFLQASPDGSQVFYTTESRIDPLDGNSTADLYRYTAGEGNVCLTCVVPAASVMADDKPPIIVSESGERAYFTSRSVLAPGATPGEINLYVWRAQAPGQLAFVAPTDSVLPGSQSPTAFATPDGAALVFISNRPELDALTGRSNGGFRQTYRYDDHTGSLRCMSCPPQQATTDAGGGNTGLYDVDIRSQLSQDGRSYFFSTGDRLVSEDVNNAPDVYEWRDDRVDLVTDGRVSSRELWLFGISANGRDVLFGKDAQLTPGARDGSTQLYDARVGGGFDVPTPPPGCEGDGCQGMSTARPDVPQPGVGVGGDERPGSRGSFNLVRLTAPQRAVLARGGRVIVRVRVDRAGLVRVSLGRYGARVAKRAGKAGTVRLAVRLSRAARRELARDRRLAATLTVRFAGALEPRTQKLDLRRPR